jgi:hypothetical protein
MTGIIVTTGFLTECPNHPSYIYPRIRHAIKERASNKCCATLGHSVKEVCIRADMDEFGCCGRSQARVNKGALAGMKKSSSRLGESCFLNFFHFFEPIFSRRSHPSFGCNSFLVRGISVCMHLCDDSTFSHKKGNCVDCDTPSNKNRSVAQLHHSGVSILLQFLFWKLRMARFRASFGLLPLMKSFN